jgi:hypothetical protein
MTEPGNCDDKPGSCDSNGIQRKRPTFRLLTWVVGVVVAGTLIGANVRLGYSFGYWDDLAEGRAVDGQAKYMVRGMGWPFQFYKIDYPAEEYYYLDKFCADILVSIAILAVTTVGTERWLRRQERQKMLEARLRSFLEP